MADERVNRFVTRVPQDWLDLADFRRSGLIVTMDDAEVFIGSVARADEPPTRRRRREEGEPEQQFTASTSEQPYDLSSLRGTLDQIWNGLTGLRSDCDQFFDQTRVLTSQVQRIAYNQEYVQPHINRWIEQERQAAPEGMHYRPYSPPPIFMPAQTTYGFYYPPQSSSGYGHGGVSHAGYEGTGSMPQIGSYTGGVGTSSGGAGPSTSSGGDRYAGHAFDYYGAGFFSAPIRDGDGDGVPSSFGPPPGHEDDPME